MFCLHHWHLPENSTMQLHVAKLPMKIPVNKYKRIESSLRTVRSSFILRITYPHSSVTPPLAGPSGRRPPGMWRSPEPSPGSGGPPGLRATHAAWRRWWQPHKARLDHPGDVHFGLLKPISFIPWLWNGQVWPKGPYPNQTKKSQNGQMLLSPQGNLSRVLCHALVNRAWWTSSTGHVAVARAAPGSGRPGLRATHAEWRRWWQPPKASLGHPGDVY